MTNAPVLDWQSLLGAMEAGRLTAGFLLSRGLTVLVAYGVFSLAQRYLVKHHLLRRIAIQINLLVLSLLLLLCLEPLFDALHTGVHRGVEAAAWFLGIMVAVSVLDVLLFDTLARWRNRPQASLVVRDIGRLLISAVALVMIVRGFFPGVNLNVLAVSSLVVGYIVGNATQDTLGNLFAGLALNAERPFHIGDWVQVAGHAGRIVDTTWRATRLKTKGEDYVVIPNAAIARESIINYSRPTGKHGCYLSVGVSYETPPGKAKEVILAILAETPEVAREPAPSVYLKGYADFSINFTIKFFIDDFERLDKIESRVMERLWYGFKRAGISIPFPIRDVRLRDAATEELRIRDEDRESVRQLLAGVDLFRTLSPPEFERLAEGVRSLVFADGESLCRQGEPGETFYVIRTGRVAVSVAGADGAGLTVAHLGPSAFFGEMSLLTGEPRSATVTAETDVAVLEVAKPVLSGILKDNAALAEKLGAILEQRVNERQARVAAAGDKGIGAIPRIALVARIRKFFGL